MEPTKGVKLRESASRDVAGDLWLVILEEALEHHSPCEKKIVLGAGDDARTREDEKEIRLDKVENE